MHAHSLGLQSSTTNQALEMRHWDHIEYSAGISWKPRLCALWLQSPGYNYLLCARLSVGYCFMLVSAGTERCGWSLSAQSYLEQSCLTRRDTSKLCNTAGEINVQPVQGLKCMVFGWPLCSMLTQVKWFTCCTDFSPLHMKQCSCFWEDMNWRAFGGVPCIMQWHTMCKSNWHHK